MNNCDYCGCVYEMAEIEVHLSFSPHRIITSADECSSCGTLLLNPEVHALIKLADYRRNLSEDAILFMVECIKRLNTRSFFVENEDGTIVDGVFIGDILGFSSKRVERILLELLKCRLAGEVKVSDDEERLGSLLINGHALGLIGRDELIGANFFTYDFFFTDVSDGESSRRRRFREKYLINDFSKKDREDLIERFDGKCALTGKDVNLHMDHVIPLSIGHGGTTEANMLPVWQRINSSKNNRNIFEWYENNGERFGVVPELFDKAIEYLAELNDMTVAEYREYVYECHANPNDNLTEVL